MSKKASLDSIDKVEIPNNLSTSSQEETLYAPSEPSVHKDHKIAEGQELYRDQVKEYVERLRSRTKELENLAKHRISYSWAILGFVSAFVLITLVILFLSALQIETPSQNGEVIYHTFLKLDEGVLKTLLITNMGQVIGVLIIVATWLFPKPVVPTKKPKAKTKSKS